MEATTTMQKRNRERQAKRNEIDKKLVPTISRTMKNCICDWIKNFCSVSFVELLFGRSIVYCKRHSFCYHCCCCCCYCGAAAFFDEPFSFPSPMSLIIWRFEFSIDVIYCQLSFVYHIFHFFGFKCLFDAYFIRRVIESGLCFLHVRNG